MEGLTLEAVTQGIKNIAALATRARLDLCAMFSRLYLDQREIKYLASLKAEYRCRAQIQPTVRAGFRGMIHDVIRMSGLLQRLPGVTRLTP